MYLNLSEYQRRRFESTWNGSCFPLTLWRYDRAMEWNRQFPSPGTCLSLNDFPNEEGSEDERVPVPKRPFTSCSPFSQSPGSLGTISFQKPSSAIPGEGFHGGFDGECSLLLNA